MPLEMTADNTMETIADNTIPLEKTADNTMPLEMTADNTIPLEKTADNTMETIADNTMPLEMTVASILLPISAVQKETPVETSNQKRIHESDSSEFTSIHLSDEESLLESVENEGESDASLASDEESGGATKESQNEISTSSRSGKLRRSKRVKKTVKKIVEIPEEYGLEPEKPKRKTLPKKQFALIGNEVCHTQSLLDLFQVQA
jgi:hypothetical protein